jgi:hypothetical protein
MPSFSKVYESIDELLNQVSDKSIPDWKSEHDESYLASDTRAKDWNGNVTLKQAIKLARFGWREGRDTMHKELEVAHRSTKFERLPTHTYDVAGYIPDVPLFISGEPAHMQTPVGNHLGMQKTLEFVVHLGANGNVSDKRMMRKGSAILSLVDKLEDSGLSCHVQGITFTKSIEDKSVFYLEFPIKKAGVPMDIDRCAYALVHPSFLRRIKFRAMEQEPTGYKAFQSGYGCSSELPIHMRIGKIYFPHGNEIRANTTEQAVHEVVEIYENQIAGNNWDGTPLED